MGVASLKRNKPVHAPETADETAVPAVAAPVSLGTATHGNLGHPPPPDFRPSQAGWRVVIASRAALAPRLLLIPWAVQAQSDPTNLTGPIVDGLIALDWDVSARNAASSSGAARVGETPTTRNPGFADTRVLLRHATFTCLCVPDDGAAAAGTRTLRAHRLRAGG